MASPDVLERVDHLRTIGRPQEAEHLIRTALAEEPRDAELLWRLAAVLLTGDRIADGLPVAQAAVAADPQSPNAHRVHALLLVESGYVAHAVHAAYTAVSLAPHHAHTAVVYAYVLHRAQRPFDAAVVARRAVELAPSDPETHVMVGDIALDTGDRATARQAYTTVLGLDPQHAGARRNLAALDHIGHRPRAALLGLIEAGRMDPDVPEVLTLVASVLWQLSWRMRIGLVVALVPLMVVSSAEADAWVARSAACAILALAGLAFWWHVRELPRGTGTVVVAALRTDGLLTVTYVFIGLCLAAYVAVAITGVAPFAVIVWPLAVLLSVIALASRGRNALRRR